VRYHRGLRGNGLRHERDVIVWLPPSYAAEQKRRYPVLYMHDGQNIIDPSTSFIGYDWHADEVSDSLIRAGTMEEIIIVGIYNSPDRMLEYSDTPLGRQYAQFVVAKVKPLIDSLYRTKPERANTAVMGSSMGGLISFLFVWWHPEIFSKAGCLSSTFSYDHGKLLTEMKQDSGPQKNFRIYMDCGGYGGESTLKPGMDSMLKLLQEKGYVENQDFLSFYDERAEHSERAWAARLWRPLTFLFGK
jgi:predicted alpha/beta superfamily hydrolase